MDIAFTIRGLAEVTARLLGLADAVKAQPYAVVGTNINYARYVEEGTKFMHARPYLVPALEQNANAIADRLERAVTNVAQGAPASEFTQALMTSGLMVQADAQRTVAVRTGTLRRSLHTEVFSR
jgi:hypothetical protein